MPAPTTNPTADIASLAFTAISARELKFVAHQLGQLLQRVRKQLGNGPAISSGYWLRSFVG
jgi:hypothetical protein